jgi:signal transduction histidine kinase
MSGEIKLLSVNNLSKYFGSVAGLVDVSFDIEPGEVLGVVGQRGSGKSTLFRLLSGVYTPTNGKIFFDGQRVQLRTAAHAQQLGIETVHQNPQLAGNLDIVSNVFLGREESRVKRLGIWPKDMSMANAVRQIFNQFDVPLEFIFRSLSDLSNEQKQIVGLARALCRPSRLLLLDDTLAELSFARQGKLLELIKQLSSQNVAVIISSEDLKHLFSITQRILVLFQGRQAALRLTAETTPREIVELIVGSNRQDQITPVIWAIESYHKAQQQAEELLQAQLALRQSLQEQDSLNRLLFERLRNQVQALDRLNLALQEANRRLITEREEERKAIARELHDQIMQDLLSYNYQLEDVENLTYDESLRMELVIIRHGIREVVSNLRQMCSDLRPPTIDSHGLAAAIRSLTHQWSKQTGIPVQLEIDPDLGRLPETIELSVFRIIQEGLSNVRKHANASLVILSMQRTPTASLLVQMIDNGKGIKKPINLATLSEEKHFGLVGISERVSLLGGSMQVKTASTAGLALQIEIPSPSPVIN